MISLLKSTVQSVGFTVNYSYGTDLRHFTTGGKKMKISQL